MCDLDEAAGLGDIGDVANGEIGLLDGEGGAVLEDLVAQVSVLLPLLVLGQELGAGSLGLDQSPEVVVEDRLSRRQLQPAHLVLVDDSGDEDALLLGLEYHVSSDVIRQLAEFDPSECLLVELYSYAVAFDGLDEPDHCQVTFLEGGTRGRLAATVLELAVAVRQLDPLANLELRSDVGADVWDSLRHEGLRF